MQSPDVDLCVHQDSGEGEPLMCDSRGSSESQRLLTPRRGFAVLHVVLDELRQHGGE